jgi:hypothetical protein
MRILANGLIGIGTTDPRQLVDVKAALDTEATFTIRSGAENKNAILYLGTPYTSSSALKVAIIAESSLSGFSRAKLHFCLNNIDNNDYPNNNASIANARMTITPEGNVGIGTTDPQQLLHLHSASNSQFIRIKITDNNSGVGVSDGVSIEKSDVHDLVLTVHENASMKFLTNNTARATITANGVFQVNGNLACGYTNSNPNFQLGTLNNNVGVAGTNGSFSSSAVAGDMIVRSVNKLILQSGTSAAAITINTNNNVGIGTALVAAANRLSIYNIAGTSNICNVTNGGELSVTGDIIGFNSYSDINLKSNIKTLSDNCIEIINKMRPVEFIWKNSDGVIETKRNKTDYGFIAQEIEQILPHLIIQSQISIYKGLRYEKITPYLVKGIQELHTLLLEYKNEINNLKIYIRKLNNTKYQYKSVLKNRINRKK